MTDVLLLRVGAEPAPRVEVLESLGEVLVLLPELDALAQRCGLAPTACGPWLRAQVATGTGRPWAVAVRTRDGRLRAAAVLVDGACLDGRPAFVLAGGGGGHRCGVAVADEASSRALGSAVGDEALLRDPSRAVQLGPLAHDDLTAVLAEALGAQVLPGDPVPAVRRTRAESASGAAGDASGVTGLSAHLSPGTRKTLRKARNRLTADGVPAAFSSTGDPREVAAALPAMEEAHRSRDLEHGLPCVLDDPAALALWRARTVALAEDGQLELARLDLDGELAAYVLGVVSGRRYGVLEGHFLTRWSRYAPGRLLEAEVLRRVVEGTCYDELDWMTSVAAETLLSVNHLAPVVTLSVARPTPGTTAAQRA